jgi:CDGSH-type Zn-finger protein
LARVVKVTAPVVSAEPGPPRWRAEPVAVPDGDYAICRCGGTGASPFCDRWPDRLPCFDEPPSTGPVPPFTWRAPDDESGPVCALKANGPLRVSGGVVVLLEDGAVADPGARVSLCRCGASQAMPFCDSSHKPVGFRDP